MKTSWDYSQLAMSYLKRPDYAPEVVEKLLSTARIEEGAPVCDVGAGVAHLTLHLLKAGLDVTAVEPNDQMRALGIDRTSEFSNVRWVEGTGEDTGLVADTFQLVTFGSSFNVTNRPASLEESARILKSEGWFACLWNHRVLEDSIQSEIQSIIQNQLPDFDHGVRREDQTEVIQASRLFKEVIRIDGQVVHKQRIEDCVVAWRSHATLQRHAGEKFSPIVDSIEQYLKSLNTSEIEVPYVTRAWLAQCAR